MVLTMSSSKIMLLLMLTLTAYRVGSVDGGVSEFSVDGAGGNAFSTLAAPVDSGLL
jgi:hypothetical protein